MPMLVKKAEDGPPGSNEGKPVPKDLSEVQRRRLASLFNQHLQVKIVASFGTIWFRTDQASASVSTEEFTYNSSKEPEDTVNETPQVLALPAPNEVPEAPAPKQPAAVVPFRSHSAKEEDSRRKRIRSRSRGGGNGGGCQDQCDQLKAWLSERCDTPKAYFCPWSPDPKEGEKLKQEYLKKVENSNTVRLMRYGDSSHRPSVPKWEPTDRTEGWHLGHPPSHKENLQRGASCVLALVKFAKYQGEYQMDAETHHFLFANYGKEFVGRPHEDPRNMVLETAQGWKAYRDYLNEWPNVPISTPSWRKFTVSVDTVLPVPNEQEDATAAEVSDSLTGEGFVLIGEPVTVWTRSVRDERAGYKRPQKRNPEFRNAVRYKDVMVDSYNPGAEYNVDRVQYRQLQFEVEWATCYAKSEYAAYLDDELKREFQAVNDPAFEEESLKKVINDLGMWKVGKALYSPSEESYLAWLRGERRAEINTSITGFSTLAFNEGRIVDFVNKVGLRQWLKGNASTSIGVASYRQAEARKANSKRKFLKVPQVVRSDGGAPPMVKAVDCAKFASIKVLPFTGTKLSKDTDFQYVITEEQYALWKAHHDKQLAEWAALQEEFVGPPKPEDMLDDWVVDPKEINELVREDTGKPLIPHPDDIAERVAANSARRVKRKSSNEEHTDDEPRYLALKRGFKNLGKSVKHFFTHEEPIWPYGQDKDNTG